MSDLRQTMTDRRVRTLVNALAVLAGVMRHEDDPHAVRITITTADGDHRLGSVCLGILPLTELVDAVRTRSTEVARQQQPAAPARPELRLVNNLPTTQEPEERPS